MTPTGARPVLLLDEGLPYGLERYLNDDGWQTQKVNSGTDDTEIVKIAKEKQFLVITQDKQLATRLKLQRVKCISIGIEDILPIVRERLKEIGQPGM